VFSAEEKKALALIKLEERQQRENALVQDFRQMLTRYHEGKHLRPQKEDAKTLKAGQKTL
jgi:hypothetical protein